MNMEVCGSSADRIEQALQRQEEIRTKAEMERRMAEIQKAAKPWENVKERCMEILPGKRVDIMRRKEEKDEHTIQKRSIGALRIIAAHQG